MLFDHEFLIKIYTLKTLLRDKGYEGKLLLIKQLGSFQDFLNF